MNLRIYAGRNDKFVENAVTIPRIGDTVEYLYCRYTVNEVVFDYDTNEIYVYTTDYEPK